MGEKSAGGSCFGALHSDVSLFFSPFCVFYDCFKIRRYCGVQYVRQCVELQIQKGVLSGYICILAIKTISLLKMD